LEYSNIKCRLIYITQRCQGERGQKIVEKDIVPI